MHILFLIILIIVIANVIGNGNSTTTRHYDTNGNLTGHSQENFYLGRKGPPTEYDERPVDWYALAVNEQPQPKNIHPLVMILGFTVAGAIVLLGVTQVLLSTVWRS
jgi:hypothetical protein